MTTQHTPGPWVFHTQPHGDRIEGGRNHSIQNNSGVVILFDPPGSETDTFEANARLIAAAPDMLSALKEITDLCKTQPANPFLADNMDRIAITAIAKAESR